MNLLTIPEYIAAFGALAAGCGYLWGQYKQGSVQSQIDSGDNKLNTNSLLKEQIDALENKVDRQSIEIQDLTSKVKLLTSALEDERKKFAETILTIQGKDPIMEEFIKTGTHYMTYSMPVFDRLNKFLDKQIL